VAEQAQRVRAALADVRAAGRLPALVVCHGGTIRAALGSTVPGVAIANGAVHRL
jgi:broad specificity phosphatase PhoE